MLSTETEMHKEHKRSWRQTKLRIEISDYKPVLSRHVWPRHCTRMSYPSRYSERMCVYRRFSGRSIPRPYDFPWKRSLIHHRVTRQNDSIHKQLEKLSLKTNEDKKPVLDTVVENIPFESYTKFYVPLGRNVFNFDREVIESASMYKPVTKDLIDNLSIDFNKLSSKISDSAEYGESSPDIMNSAGS